MSVVPSCQFSGACGSCGNSYQLSSKAISILGCMLQEMCVCIAGCFCCPLCVFYVTLMRLLIAHSESGLCMYCP